MDVTNSTLDLNLDVEDDSPKIDEFRAFIAKLAKDTDAWVGALKAQMWTGISPATFNKLIEKGFINKDGKEVTVNSQKLEGKKPKLSAKDLLNWYDNRRPRGLAVGGINRAFVNMIILKVKKDNVESVVADAKARGYTALTVSQYAAIKKAERAAKAAEALAKAQETPTVAA